MEFCFFFESLWKTESCWLRFDSGCSRCLICLNHMIHTFEDLFTDVAADDVMCCIISVFAATCKRAKSTKIRPEFNRIQFHSSHIILFSEKFTLSRA